MRPGIRIGIDVGTVRIGVAQSDPAGILASPVATIARADEDFIDQLARLVIEAEAIEVVVGLPLSLSGGVSASTQDALNVVHELARHIGVEVRLLDERLTTVSALGAVKASGKSQKKSRAFIDQVAAVSILNAALDAERLTGRQPGKPLGEFPL
jgi:putative Holliday junction resolvase